MQIDVNPVYTDRIVCAECFISNRSELETLIRALRRSADTLWPREPKPKKPKSTTVKFGEMPSYGPISRYRERIGGDLL